MDVIQKKKLTECSFWLEALKFWSLWLLSGASTKSSQKVRCPNFKKLRLGAINFHFSKVGRKDKSGIINGGEIRKFWLKNSENQGMNETNIPELFKADF